MSAKSSSSRGTCRGGGPRRWPRSRVSAAGRWRRHGRWWRGRWRRAGVDEAAVRAAGRQPPPGRRRRSPALLPSAPACGRSRPGEPRVHGHGDPAGPVHGRVGDQPPQCQLRADMDAHPATRLHTGVDQSRASALAVPSHSAKVMAPTSTTANAVSSGNSSAIRPRCSSINTGTPLARCPNSGSTSCAHPVDGLAQKLMAGDHTPSTLAGRSTTRLAVALQS